MTIERRRGLTRGPPVLRTDKPHPHVQAVVKALSEHGIRLHIRKPMLRRWRLEFARHLREQHIAANATERVLRGQIRASRPPALYHTERRGASTRLHARAESVMDGPRRRVLRTEQGKSKLVQTRAVIERRWRAIQRALTRRGMTDLAEEVRRFVDEMEPPMTDREQLAGDISSGRSRPRQNTPLFSR
jgi:predicted ArsR family transcriptional regulator